MFELLCWKTKVISCFKCSHWKERKASCHGAVLDANMGMIFAHVKSERNICVKVKRRGQTMSPFSHIGAADQPGCEMTGYSLSPGLTSGRCWWEVFTEHLDRQAAPMEWTGSFKLEGGQMQEFCEDRKTSFSCPCASLRVAANSLTSHCTKHCQGSWPGFSCTFCSTFSPLQSFW